MVKRRSIINAVAVVLLAAAGLRLFLFFNPSPPTPDVRAHRALGAILAGETAPLLDAGGRLIVIAREVSEFKVLAAEAQITSFQEGIRKAGKSVAILRQIKMDPLRTLAPPAGEFFEVMRQAKENDVIVSFLGPPALDDDQLAKLPSPRPKILAVCPEGMSSRVDLSRAFEQKLLVAAVISRPDAPGVPAPGDPQRAFEQMFKVINVANLSELPSLVAAKEKGR